MAKEILKINLLKLEIKIKLYQLYNIISLKLVIIIRFFLSIYFLYPYNVDRKILNEDYKFHT